MRARAACSERGFTLLEVLVAVAILAATVAVLQIVSAQTVRAASEVGTKLIAKTLVREKMESVAAGIETGSGGSFEAYPEFSWERTEEVRTIAGEQTAILVTVSVRYPTRKADGAVSFFDSGGAGDGEDPPGIVRLTTLIEPPEVKKARQAAATAGATPVPGGR
jgi:type II secretion system protein I